MTRRSRSGAPWPYYLGALLLGLLVATSLAEALVRLSGRQPFTFHAKDRNEPTMNQPDPVLGWRSKEGVYRIPPYREGGEEIVLTIDSRGRRPAGASPGRGPAMVIVGGSFTHGFALPDHETFAWKLQQRYPGWNVSNYGASAYGTYQCLLLLERELPQIETPRIILYGLHWHHERRNVAAAGWLLALSQYSRRGHVDVPYATVGADGALVRHAPDHHTVWPLRQKLASVALAARVYKRFQTRAREATAREVTQRLVVEMAELGRRHGARLVVVTLYADEEFRTGYARFLEDRGIDRIDCAHPVPEEMMIPGEGHPNGEVNTYWADCIAAGLEASGATSTADRGYGSVSSVRLGAPPRPGAAD